MFRSCCRGEPRREVSLECTQEEKFVKVEPPIPTVPILVEVVGATNLLGREATGSERQSGRRTSSSVIPAPRPPPDPYCLISIHGREVHRTETINREANPIWTVKSSSLAIFHIPCPQGNQAESTTKASSSSSSLPKEHDNQINDDEDSTVASSFSSFTSSRDCLRAEVFDGKRSLGEVKLGFDGILQCKGERLEFPIAEDWQSCRTYEEYSDNPATAEAADDDAPLSAFELPQSMLALRFRRATPDDVSFLQSLDQNGHFLLSTAINSARTLQKSFSSIQDGDTTQDEEAMDVDFRAVATKGLFSYHRKKDSSGNTLIRLQPPLERELGEPPLEWMTKEKIQEVALEPSTKWVETGTGTAGTLYLEVIGCDDLPGMDMDGSTDPFVTVVFENTMLRTKVIEDTCCPRWLPWSTRAFAININHPASMIFLGVFDYDEDLAVTDFCDPVGRIVINTMNFESSVQYFLHYDLIDSSQIDSPRGRITVRLRLERESKNEAAKLALKPPPRFIVNVETEKAWHVLHYCTYGAVNMDKPSMSSVKLYMSEVYQFWRNYCYFLDVMVAIFLWRGRANLTLLGYTVNVWFPIHSVWLFTSMAMAYEKPAFAPAIFFYGLAWIMISVNFYNSRHPYHWHRVKKFEHLAWGIFTGSEVSLTRTVEANQHFNEFHHYHELDTLKADRMMALLYAFMTTALKAYRIYSGTSITNIVDTTEDKVRGITNYILSDKLYYPHMLLKYISSYGRSFRNFLNWKSYSSFPTTLNLLTLGTLCLLPPLHWVASVVCRLLIWTFLGPGMKVFDIVFVSQYYKTDERLLDDIVNDRVDKNYWFLPFFDSIIEHDVFCTMRRSGRIVAERAAKLKDMREQIHGSWSERVPWVDNSRRASVPLPQSSAKLFTEDELAQSQRADWKYTPGKKLVGDMIPRCHGCSGSSRRCTSSSSSFSNREKKEQ